MGIDQQGSAFSSTAVGATGASVMRASTDINAPGEFQTYGGPYDGPQTTQSPYDGPQTTQSAEDGDDEAPHARAVNPGAENWETGFGLAGDILAERDEKRGFTRLKGVSLILIEYDTSTQQGWPTDFSLDEVRNSLRVACDHRHLSLEDMKVTKGERRASFAARLRTDTCKVLAEDLLLDLYPGPNSRGDDAEVEFRVYLTDERGNKVNDGATGPKAGQKSEAARKQESEQRKKLMFTIHYNFPRDLLLADDNSPIFDKIKQDIRTRINLAYGSAPASQPQHINLLDAKTGEGESAHGLSLHIVNNISFASMSSTELHRAVDLSHLKYVDSGNGSLVVSRMPKHCLKSWEAKSCCYRHDPMEVCTDPPANTCPSDQGACQIRRQTLDNIQSTLRESDSYTPGQTERGERISVQKRRMREESLDGRKQAAAAHRTTIQIPTCKAWEAGRCRSISFIEGSRKCPRAHPDELTATNNIECCSSAARPKPERCYFAPARCPYQPGTHREAW